MSKNPEIKLDILSLSDGNKKNLRYNFPRLFFYRTSRNSFFMPLELLKNKLERQKNILRNRKLSKYSHLEQKLIEGDYDIIHLQQSFLLKRIPNLIKEKLKTKLIVTFRGGDTYVKPWIDENWRESFLKNLGTHNAICQVMSENQKHYLSRWGVPIENIYVISTGVNREVFEPAPFKKLGTELQICSVFRFCWEKNIELNLRVIAALRDNNISVKYHVFGGGPDLGQLFYLIDKFGLHEHVIYRGKVRPDKLNEEFKKLDITLQMSASDALPTSILEAQACGLPAIVSDNGGLPESVVQGETGFSLPYGNIELAVEKIRYLTDEKVYNSFRSKCIDFIENNFSTKVEVTKVLNMYKMITHNKR